MRTPHNRKGSLKTWLRVSPLRAEPFHTVRLVGGAVSPKHHLWPGERTVLEGSAAVGFVGRGQDRQREAPARSRGNPQQVRNLGVWYQRQTDYTFNFHANSEEVPEPRTNRYANNSETGEEGGKGTKVGAEWSSGLWKTPLGPRRKTEQVRPAATWGAQLSPPPIHSVNASPSGRLAGLQTATESQ